MPAAYAVFPRERRKGRRKRAIAFDDACRQQPGLASRQPPAIRGGAQAKAAVGAALALYYWLALAHAVQGTIKWRVDYDAAAGGEAALRRAMELDPSSGLVLCRPPRFCCCAGRLGTRAPVARQGDSARSTVADRNVQVGFSLAMIGRYAAAVERFEHALALDSRYLTARFWLAEALGYQGRQDRAVSRTCRGWTARCTRNWRLRCVAGWRTLYARGGWSAFWRGGTERHAGRGDQPGCDPGPPGQNRFAGPWYIARRQARLGRRDEALDSLNSHTRGGLT